MKNRRFLQSHFFFFFLYGLVTRPEFYMEGQTHTKYLNLIWKLQVISLFKGQHLSCNISLQPGWAVFHTWQWNKGENNLKRWQLSWGFGRVNLQSPCNLQRWLSGNALHEARLVNLNSSPIQKRPGRDNIERTQSFPSEVWKRYQK